MPMKIRFMMCALVHLLLLIYSRGLLVASIHRLVLHLSVTCNVYRFVEPNPLVSQWEIS